MVSGFLISDLLSEKPSPKPAPILPQPRPSNQIKTKIATVAQSPLAATPSTKENDKKLKEKFAKSDKTNLKNGGNGERKRQYTKKVSKSLLNKSGKMSLKQANGTISVGTKKNFNKKLQASASANANASSVAPNSLPNLKCETDQAKSETKTKKQKSATSDSHSDTNSQKHFSINTLLDDPIKSISLKQVSENNQFRKPNGSKSEIPSSSEPNSNNGANLPTLESLSVFLSSQKSIQNTSKKQQHQPLENITTNNKEHDQENGQHISPLNALEKLTSRTFDQSEASEQKNCSSNRQKSFSNRTSGQDRENQLKRTLSNNSLPVGDNPLPETQQNADNNTNNVPINSASSSEVAHGANVPGLSNQPPPANWPAVNSNNSNMSMQNNLIQQYRNISNQPNFINKAPLSPNMSLLYAAMQGRPLNGPGSVNSAPGPALPSPRVHAGTGGQNQNLPNGNCNGPIGQPALPGNPNQPAAATNGIRLPINNPVLNPFLQNNLVQQGNVGLLGQNALNSLQRAPNPLLAANPAQQLMGNQLAQRFITPCNQNPLTNLGNINMNSLGHLANNVNNVNVNMSHVNQMNQALFAANANNPAANINPAASLMNAAAGNLFQNFANLPPGLIPFAAAAALSGGNLNRRRRKSRTAFSTDQLAELEKKFQVQKYLTPIDRDNLANKLGLRSAQVITWFQNRRAKMKREDGEGGSRTVGENGEQNGQNINEEDNFDESDTFESASLSGGHTMPTGPGMTDGDIFPQSRHALLAAQNKAQGQSMAGINEKERNRPNSSSITCSSSTNVPNQPTNIGPVNPLLANNFLHLNPNQANIQVRNTLNNLGKINFAGLANFNVHSGQMQNVFGVGPGKNSSQQEEKKEEGPNNEAEEVVVESDGAEGS